MPEAKSTQPQLPPLDGLTDVEAVAELKRQLLAEMKVSAGLRALPFGSKGDK